jgi:nuclear migration protein JNM1
VNNQLSVLAQPRHIDSISRRLKILISELDRAGHQRRQSGVGSGGQVDHQIAALLHRVGPLLPQIPHILTRLRTLSKLHGSAGEFQSTLERLEEEEEKTKEEVGELEKAVETLEESLVENRQVMKGNVEGLETRLNSVFKRLESME